MDERNWFTTIECAYCGVTIEGAIEDEPTPALDDDDAWAEEADLHRPGCEWVETRAHRLNDDERVADAKPVVRLIGDDGNVFAIMGRVRKALADAGRDERASECLKRMTAAGSYDEALGIVFEYCEVR